LPGATFCAELISLPGATFWLGAEFRCPGQRFGSELNFVARGNVFASLFK